MNKILAFVMLLCSSVANAQMNYFDWEKAINRKQFVQVLAHAAELSSLEVENSEICEYVAQAHEGMLHYKEALAYYNKCYEKDTTDLDIINALARVSANLGRVKDAEKFFGKAIEADSTNFYANYQLARLYYNSGRYEMAIEKYSDLLDDDDSDAIRRMIGDCYLKLEDYMNAATIYLNVFDNNHENPSLAITLANTLYKIGNAAVSYGIKICDTALVYNPDNKELLRTKGFGLFTNKEFAEADTIFSNLLAKGDSSFTVAKYCGASKYYAGQYMNSIEPLEIAYAKDSSDVSLCLLLGSSLGKTYDRAMAFRLFDNAEKLLRPDSLLVNMLLTFRAETYRKDGNTSEAIKLYYEAYKNTGRIDYLYSVATMSHVPDYSKIGDKDRDKIRRSIYASKIYIEERMSSLNIKPGEGVTYYKLLDSSVSNLERACEDMFFRKIDEETLITPDGKRYKATLQELKAIVNKAKDIKDI
jgi:tetratricopeptide (TPR) repeat protein